MRLIHEIVEDLRGPADEDVTPLSAALTALLEGERGSLAELRQRFADVGLGPVIESWRGNGRKLPIRPQDLRVILGEERAEDLATLAGMTSSAFLARLARVLPDAVHRLEHEAEDSGA
jgi:uncharacterized protein YidB (DUF937 family)